MANRHGLCHPVFRVCLRVVFCQSAFTGSHSQKLGSLAIQKADLWPANVARCKSHIAPGILVPARINDDCDSCARVGHDLVVRCYVANDHAPR